MTNKKIRETVFTSILRESPIYSELGKEEKQRLIKDLMRVYPRMFEAGREEVEVGDEASWLRDQY
ncbi:MAG: hypothetical protein AABZ36_04970 [Nitrospirota bacterium]|mgnify:FL=1